jgi:uncharacterized membrane protein YsdA (DUF1294 family)
MNKHRTPPSRIRCGHGVSASSVLVLLLLLVIPAYALSRSGTWIDWRLLAGVPAALSIFTFFLFRSDKLRAEAGQWRIPEATLHTASFMGGWPGAFLAQRTFRHKGSKASFQATFWAIVIAHQFVAIDSLMGWRITKDVVRFIKTQTG